MPIIYTVDGLLWAYCKAKVILEGHVRYKEEFVPKVLR